MNESAQNGVPWILWPFYFIWKLVTLILNITGRILCALLGIGLMAIGVPLLAFGFLLTVRALF